MKLIKLWFMATVLTVTGAAQAVELNDAQKSMQMEQLTIGYMFQEVLFEQSAIAKLYKPSIEAQNRKIEQKGNELIAELQEMQKTYKNEQGIATDQELQVMQQEMKQKEYDIQVLQQQQQQLYANFTQSFSQQFGSVYSSALELVVKEKQLDLVFDGNNLLHVNENLNISTDVLKKFDELTAASYEQLKAQLESQKATQ
ncbi:OmpH family outer membrane protein [Marinicellulosiphila megalodicopiae]|uniref:OmpH family outer membrane protein n=1 Tax=Marinicellulosiphila megalodicopiae TaxID=2724896 RepID=UPI003BB09805